MGATVLSYVLGIIGIIIGFCMSESSSNELSGFELIWYIPLRLLFSAIGGATGYIIGDLLRKGK